MNANHSSAEYQPTIIESRLLIKRLAIQLAFLSDEFKICWNDFKSEPLPFVKRSTRELFRRSKQLLSSPNAVPACLTAVVTVVCIVMLALLIEKTARRGVLDDDTTEPPEKVVMLDVEHKRDSTSDSRFGISGSGRVGVNQSTGEGSGPKPKPSSGGGGGGNRDRHPGQVGELPPPSNIVAAIPINPPKNPQALPVAGIIIDPALWKDLKAPVYGDPRSNSEIPSKGPGQGEGIGWNGGWGVGVGEGAGPGFGKGTGGNTGGGSNEQGCCGSGSGAPPGSDQPFLGREVEQRARLLSKPEPQYTEEARRNQIEGTVMLRVVFSSSGEVVQIRAVRTLPFGLTERAIAAARQIRFVPAMKSGHPVSVYMQLEYNFNLY